MKQKEKIKLYIIIFYSLSAILLFLIAKERLGSIYRYFSIIIGVIATIYLIPFALIKSINEKTELKNFSIISDIIFYLAIGYLILKALADNPIFEVVGIIISILNFAFCIFCYLKSSNDRKELKSILILHICLMFLIPLIN